MLLAQVEEYYESISTPQTALPLILLEKDERVTLFVVLPKSEIGPQMLCSL